MKKKYIAFILLLTVLVALQYSSVLMYATDGVPSGFVKRLAQELAAAFFCLGGFLYLTSLTKPTFWICWPLLITGCVVYGYFSHFFKYYLDLELLSIVLGGTKEEAVQMFPYSAFGIGLLASVLVCFLFKKAGLLFRPSKYAASFFFLVIFICFVSRKVGSSSVPMNLLHSLKLYAFLQTPERQDIGQPSTNEVFPNDRIFGLVRLESMTGLKHYPNGYERNTMPLVNSTKNIVNYPNFYSLGQRTSVATPFMFTRGNEEHPERAQNEESFIAQFKKLGWQTLFESPSAANFSKPFRFYNSIAEEADEHLYVPDDEDVPAFYKSVLEKQTKPLCLTTGFNSVHRPFGRRPKTEVYYQPDCFAANLDEMLKCPIEAVNNAYDSEVRFIDKLVHQIIEAVKGKEALLFFVSDHGEMLTNDGFHRPVKGDRSKSKTLRNVVAFVWASDRWIAKYPEEWKNIQKNAPYYMNSEVLFHSALDCNRIDSPALDKEKSICSATFKENEVFKERYENAGPVDPIKEGMNINF